MAPRRSVARQSSSRQRATYNWGQPLIVVAATTKFSEPLSDDQVRLPWHPNGQARTRLHQPTVAVCTWLCEIQEKDIVRYGGVVPPKTMEEILAVLNKLK